MTITPTLVEKLLAVKTPSGLAKVLFGASYKTLGQQIYPKTKYREFTLKKKNGSDRLIAAPKYKLLLIQRRIAKFIQQVAITKPAAHGFVPGKSIVTNANCHCDKGKKTYIFNIDLKDFFPSITFPRIRGLFMAPPFSYPHSVATVLAHACCHNGVLPQGAPTSPILSNLICRGLDGDLQRLAQECRATYTRYADDISFSFTVKGAKYLPDRIVKVSGSTYGVGDSLQEIVSAHTFHIHPDKVRLHSRHGRMEVTGITVNQFPNVRRRFVHQIRGMLHAWDKHGVVAADQEFQNKKIYSRQLRSGKRPRFDRVLWGKLLYLKMVKGNFDPVYVRLARRYSNLAKRDELLVDGGFRKLPTPNTVIDQNELSHAVYVIECYDDKVELGNQGTAFFLEGVGLVTCEHVISHPETDVKKEKYLYFGRDGCGTVQLKSPLGTVLCDLEIVYLNRKADLAILRPLKEVAGPMLYLRQNKTATSKDEVVCVVGYPDHKPSKTLACDWGPVLTPYRKFGLNHFHIKPLIQVGNSGGPVITSSLGVVGMAKEGAKQEGGENSVLCVSEIKQLLEKFKTDGKTD